MQERKLPIQSLQRSDVDKAEESVMAARGTTAQAPKTEMIRPKAKRAWSGKQTTETPDPPFAVRQGWTSNVPQN